MAAVTRAAPRRRRAVVAAVAALGLMVTGCVAPVNPQADDVIRIGVVAPSSSHDSSFTDSMARALDFLSERYGHETELTDNTPIVSEAAVAIRGYALDGYDLVVAHGSQYTGIVREIAPDFPDTSFALGTSPVVLEGLDNVFTYTAEAAEGGCIAGAIAGLLTQTNIIGAVLPHEVGDALAWASGFTAGVERTNPDATVRVRYTGSFTDTRIAAEYAASQIGNGADVLTGSSQIVAGAVGTAAEREVPWLGNQSNQTALAPEVVVVSQVYRWEVLLQEMVALVGVGILGSSEVLPANISRGGLELEFNPDYALDAEVRQVADDLVRLVRTGEGSCVDDGGDV